MPESSAPAPPQVRVEPLSAAEVEPAWEALERAFGSSAHPADRDVEVGLVDPTRFYGARLPVPDGDEVVGTAGSWDFTMTVPGARLPVAGVTWVGVAPIRRRRGVLGALMRRQLDDLHEAGTAVAALWASEAAIYGRYGYGPAAWRLQLTVRHAAALRAPVTAGDLQRVRPGGQQVRQTYERVAATTAGWPQRDDAWWAFAVHDPEHRREGAGPLECVQVPGGYASYAVASRWVDGLPASQVRVSEVVAETRTAHAQLWRYLLDLDLTAEVTAAVAVDDPLVMDLLAEPRAARAALRDCLHVRLVDVPSALAGRRYATDVDVVLAVDDPRCPWNSGCWRLVGGPDGASCEPTTAEPALALPVADLGAAYLGGTPLRSRGDVVELLPGALSRATTAFGPLTGAPWCPLVF
jgi:predicted acetyltransferase